MVWAGSLSEHMGHHVYVMILLTNPAPWVVAPKDCATGCGAQHQCCTKCVHLGMECPSAPTVLIRRVCQPANVTWGPLLYEDGSWQFVLFGGSSMQMSSQSYRSGRQSDDEHGILNIATMLARCTAGIMGEKRKNRGSPKGQPF